jgi:GDPmannose 4,6-dehydratase
VGNQRSAIITGITGMDGSHLADLLLSKEYKVYGFKRRSSSNNLGNASHLPKNSNFELVEGDITDLSSLLKLCSLAKADEFFHLAAQSHVGISFKEPIHTLRVNAQGTMNCLEAVRLSGYHTRFYNAATSELFGGMSSKPANEETPFHPRSPYGVGKMAAYWATVNYRETYKFFACNGILFNHEGERRGPNFVTRKISLAVGAIKRGEQEKLYLGNLDAKRDWGYAPDYVEAMWMMLQNNDPDDYVVGTGETHSIREFCQVAFEHAGLDYNRYVEIDPRFYRPCEVDVLKADYSKINKVLGWEPTVTFKSLVKRMVDADIKKC